MIPFIPLLLAAGTALAYGEWQRKRGAASASKDAEIANLKASADDSKTPLEKTQNIYNYNGISDSAYGTTLFQQPTSQNSRRKTNAFS